MKRANVCGELTEGEMGADLLKRGERVEGLKSGSDPEDVAGRALVSNDVYEA